jgi:hypothetical protein
MYSGGDNVSEEPVASIFRVEKFVTPKWELQSHMSALVSTTSLQLH